MLNDSNVPPLVTEVSVLDQAKPVSITQSRIQAVPAFPKIRRWTHTPSRFVLLWLYSSLPLIAWDVMYCLGRPHTMPGGKWHDPIWTPYKYYIEVDHVYGWKAWEESNGFTAAQACMNIIECALYLVYLWLVREAGRAAPLGNPAMDTSSIKSITRNDELAMAPLVGFSGALMTFSKTVLYVLNEHFSGYPYIRECAFWKVMLFYVIPSGTWVVCSGFMTGMLGSQVFEALKVAWADDLHHDKILSDKSD